MTTPSAPALDVLDPGRTALLVIDMQNAFCHPEGTLGISGVNVAPAQAIVEPIRRLVERARAADVPVLWSQQVHFETDAGRVRKRLPSHTQKRARVSALAGTWDMELVDGLRDLAEAQPEHVFQKHRFGCFYETRLDAALRMLGAEALLVCGATANACVETTLREAYLRDYDVVAVTDCIAAVRPEWEPVAHAVWAQYLGVLATSADVLAWLERARSPRAMGLGHLLLQVSDLDAAERFYLDLLGLTVRKREDFRDGRPLVVTHQGLGLTNGRPEGRGPLEHVAFSAHDVAGLAERARAEGVTVVRGPEPSSYGLSLYLADPDGNVVEVFGQEQA
jgi:nicotinamidase-related amidase/catechol 2,3-dioxygenase-like lactoylglutathione lyase family enzyme